MRIESSLYSQIRASLSRDLHFDVNSTTTNLIENRSVGNLGEAPVNPQDDGIFFTRNTVFSEDFIWGK